jgi:hypothetical protein
MITDVNLTGNKSIIAYHNSINCSYVHVVVYLKISAPKCIIHLPFENSEVSASTLRLIPEVKLIPQSIYLAPLKWKGI